MTGRQKAQIAAMQRVIQNTLDDLTGAREALHALSRPASEGGLPSADEECAHEIDRALVGMESAFVSLGYAYLHTSAAARIAGAS